ncbi:hypothetical protein P154DRAFT_173075 [Amniculicola lignicola CBS 123094]|uniref:Uncharacterized protein n=1 Tax=Amniculicola lignicola CBS 123094 TaxID=1392246 RepID=A0A6A5WHP8_9PLEO|nr:hypothetical protein P154DRAFT_173075 [Amniculicola lignicola CBS 123094]
MALPIPTVTPVGTFLLPYGIVLILQDDLRNFHATHFPGQSFPPLPTSFAHDPVEDLNETYDEGDDGLGYYEDGVKRTLTDNEIAYMRNKEIREIFEERRRQKHHSLSTEPEASKSEMSIHPSKSVSDGEASSTSNTPSNNPIPPEQWTKVSQRTKSKAKRKNVKQRRLRRERLQDMKKKKANGVKRDEEMRENDESDEWDPWHQANGPDVQKDSPAIDLDY